VPHIVQRLAKLAVFASWVPGVSERGHVVLDDNKDRHISLLHGPQCHTTARIELPLEVEYWCRKAVDASGRVLVQAREKNADTISLDSEGREIYRSKSYGELLTCMGDILGYKERIAGMDEAYRIGLQRGADASAMFLEPPGGWGPGLSVCRHNNGTYCVTENWTKSLDIFTAAGQPPYIPLFDISLLKLL
jgi:hypothetical protein